MLNLVVRGLLLVAAIITSWLVAEGEPRFGAVQMVVAVLLFVLFVFVVGFWPARWSIRLRGREKLR